MSQRSHKLLRRYFKHRAGHDQIRVGAHTKREYRRLDWKARTSANRFMRHEMRETTDARQ